MHSLNTKKKKHYPKKRFGQHFLHHTGIIQEIVKAIHPHSDDNMVEIGPGLGALTEPLLEKLNHLTAIEIDNDLYDTWLRRAKPNLTLIHADALSVDFSTLGEKIRLVGNLPYNVSTPLIIHFLKNTPQILDMHFMLQKEVVTRLAAEPGTKAFGRLSVMVQYHCDVEALFDVPPDAFDPPPKVDSSIVRITPYLENPYPKVDMLHFEQLVAQAFSMRRKTLANNLKTRMTATTIESLGIDPKQRPEQLSVADYVKLALHLLKK